MKPNLVTIINTRQLQNNFRVIILPTYILGMLLGSVAVEQQELATER